MFGNTIHAALIHAATRYDVRQSKGKRYNPYALAQYFGRIEEVEADIAAGASPRAALCAAFSGSLLNTMLKAIDESPCQPGEKNEAAWTYQPVAAR